MIRYFRRALIVQDVCRGVIKTKQICKKTSPDKKLKKRAVCKRLFFIFLRPIVVFFCKLTALICILLRFANFVARITALMITWNRKVVVEPPVPCAWSEWNNRTVSSDYAQFCLPFTLFTNKTLFGRIFVIPR